MTMWKTKLVLLKSIPDFSGKVDLNLALGLVSSCYGHQTARWRPTCWWLGWKFMSIGVTPVKAIKVGVGLIFLLKFTHSRPEVKPVSRCSKPLNEKLKHSAHQCPHFVPPSLGTQANNQTQTFPMQNVLETKKRARLCANNFCCEILFKTRKKESEVERKLCWLKSFLYTQNVFLAQSSSCKSEQHA